MSCQACQLKCDRLEKLRQHELKQLSPKRQQKRQMQLAAAQRAKSEQRLQKLKKQRKDALDLLSTIALMLGEQEEQLQENKSDPAMNPGPEQETKAWNTSVHQRAEQVHQARRLAEYHVWLKNDGWWDEYCEAQHPEHKKHCVSAWRRVAVMPGSVNRDPKKPGTVMAMAIEEEKE
jgi:hypothetical protein